MRFRFRRPRLRRGGLLLLLAFSSIPCASLTAAPAPPNLIVFLVDDLGWQDTSVPFWTRVTPLNERYRTPQMERLAEQGLRFTQAYASSICSPSRVSLLTGMNAARHRVTHWTLHRGTSTDRPHPRLRPPDWNVNGLQPGEIVERATVATPLPQLLREHGYVTIHAGKAHWGAAGTPGADPRNLGFDVNIAGHAAGAPGSHRGEKNYSQTGINGASIWDVPGLAAYHGTSTPLAEALTREALTALEDPVRQGRPFFLHLSHYAVHTPLEADTRFAETNTHLHPTEAIYASMIEGVDKSLGDVLDFLDRHALAEKTVLFFTSDNGGLSAHARGGPPHTHNRPLKSGKGSAYEGGIRVPLLVRWPGHVPAGHATPHPVLLEDLFPTLLDLAGIDSPRLRQTVDGLPLRPWLHRPGTPSPPRDLVWHAPHFWGGQGPGIGPSSTLRRGDWKLIYRHDRASLELYHLADDIGEETNLAPTHPETVRRLARRLGDRLRAVEAQRPRDIHTGRPVPWPDEIPPGPAPPSPTSAHHGGRF